MDALTELITRKLPVGDGVSGLVDMLLKHFGKEFRLLSAFLENFIQLLGKTLSAVHPIALILIFTLATWLVRRSKGLALFCLAGFLLILNLGLWAEMVDTLALILTATVLSLVVGIPTGILNAHNRTAYIITRPLLDFMQTIPPFVYLIPALMFFGLGEVPGVIATVIFSMPPVIRLTCHGIQQVPEELIEAGKAFGSNFWQMLTKVELPAAFPTIMMGVNQTIMMALSMVVIAALIGAGGLGSSVMRSLAMVDVGMGFESGLGIVILAMLLDRIVRTED